MPPDILRGITQSNIKGLLLEPAHPLWQDSRYFHHEAQGIDLSEHEKKTLPDRRPGLPEGRGRGELYRHLRTSVLVSQGSTRQGRRMCGWRMDGWTIGHPTRVTVEHQVKETVDEGGSKKQANLVRTVGLRDGRRCDS